MEHVDEGTLHAWLDDALSAEEGRRIEMHATECPTCAAAIAEARGLVAASSRILSALDDVPGGVIPVAGVATRNAANGGASALDVRAKRQRPGRPWYLRTQFAAAAGIVFVAMATTVVLQQNAAPNVADYSAAPANTSPSPVAVREEPVASGGQATEADSRAKGRFPASAPLLAADRRGAATRKEAASTTSPRGANSAGATDEAASRTPAPPLPEQRSAMSREGSKRMEAPPPAPKPRVAAEAAPALSMRDTVRAGKQAQAATAADSPASGERRSLGRAASSDSVLAKSRLTLSADEIVKADRARALGERDVQLQSDVVTGAASSAPSRSAGSPAALAGCYRLEVSALTRQAALGDVLQLDFSAAGVDDRRPAYVARDLTRGDAESKAPVLALRWTIAPSGQVTIIRGDGDAASRVVLSISAAALTPPGHARATRIDCPAQ